jgi:protein gp37
LGETIDEVKSEQVAILSKGIESHGTHTARALASLSPRECDHTFNPWKGCTKVSEGCLNCYAEKWATTWGKSQGIIWNNPPKLSSSIWNNPKKWNEKVVGTRETVFCASIADVFDANAPEEWRERLWQLIKETRNLAWLLLTKRPQNIEKFLPREIMELENVWLGCSIENQLRADQRLPIMRSLPTPRTFLSVEPLLEEVSFPLEGISWIIVGGESGNEARSFHLEWAIALKEQADREKVPFFFKQAGSKAFFKGKPLTLTDKKGGNLEEMPILLQSRCFPEWGKSESQLSLI